MYAGFDIGGTNARANLYDDDWSEVTGVRQRIRGRTSPDEIAEVIGDMLVDLDEAAGESTIDGIGVGLAGQLDSDGRTILNAPNLGWRDEAFADRLESTIDASLGEVRVALVNDLNGLLWGEARDGALRDTEHALAVYVGTGVGGGVLVDDRLVVGAGGVAGEIGHSKVAPGGRLCGCGERGCVEAYAGGIHLEERIARAADDRPALSEVFVDTEADEIDLSAADELADDHEAIGEIWEEATDYLAMVTANACTLLNPGVLLIGGGVVDNCAYFRETFLAKTTPLVLEASRRDLAIRRPELGDDAGMLGAARLASIAPVSDS